MYDDKTINPIRNKTFNHTHKHRKGQKKMQIDAKYPKSEQTQIECVTKYANNGILMTNSIDQIHFYLNKSHYSEIRFEDLSAVDHKKKYQIDLIE